MKKQVRFLLRNHKRRIGLLLGLCLTIVMFCGSVFTYAANEYQYTVRIYAGDKGTFTSSPAGGTITDGGKTIVIDKLDPGTMPAFSNSMVSVTDGKYYVKGIREAGKDNSTVGSSAPTIRQDSDYVVAYGIKGQSVQYTVEYVDVDGNTLANSQTYYGNVGDRPVVAYLYIDGYFPNAYNITGTLRENASQNVFTFIYQEIPEETAEAPAQQQPAAATTTTGGTTTTAAGGTTAGTAAGGTAAGGTAAGGTAAGAAAGAAGGTAAGAAGGTAAGAAGAAAGGTAAGAAGTEGTAGGAENANLPETPQAVPEVIDQDVPMAVPENSSSSSSSSAASSSSSSSAPTTETISENDTPRAGMTGGKIAGIVIAIAAAAAAAIFGARYAMNKNRGDYTGSSTDSETYKFDDDGNLKKKD